MTQREMDYAIEDFLKRNPKFRQMMQDNPLTAWEMLKQSGLLLWKGGKWLIGVPLFIALGLGGALGYGIWKYFKNKTGAEREGGGGEGSSDLDPIKDEKGNVYKPCTGTYRINCVTKEGEGGDDFITKAQRCLGLSETGMFDKELENKLASKLNKRSFTKEDIKYICMGGGTLAQL